VLGVIGFALAFVVWRRMPEPPRGAQGSTSRSRKSQERHSGGRSERALAKDLREHDVHPDTSQVTHDDPTAWPLWRAVRHILSVRTYVALVIASSLGYFYFTGVRTFAIQFMRARFALGESAAIGVTVALGIGAIGGVLVAGRIGDALIGRNVITGRVLVGACAYLVAAIAFAPGLLVSSLLVAAPCFVVAAAGIGGANPAVDAARLDVMHAALWGRAEGVRATLRRAFEAAAPPLFAYAAILLGGKGNMAGATASDVAGLDRALVAMLATLALAGLVLLFGATRTYARDAATAIASDQSTR
jgi:hypothetical protein